MSRCSVHYSTLGRGDDGPCAMRLRLLLTCLLWPALAGPLVCQAQESSDPVLERQTHFLTNIAQFKSLSEKDYLNECRFHLTGVVTLLDTNRNLLSLRVF